MRRDEVIWKLTEKHKKDKEKQKLLFNLKTDGFCEIKSHQIRKFATEIRFGYFMQELHNKVHSATYLHISLYWL